MEALQQHAQRVDAFGQDLGSTSLVQALAALQSELGDEPETETVAQ